MRIVACSIWRDMRITQYREQCILKVKYSVVFGENWYHQQYVIVKFRKERMIVVEYGVR